jgi:FkbM family methyltransferase
MRITHPIRSIWCNPGNRGRYLRQTVAAFLWQLRKRTYRSTKILRLRSGALFKAYPDCVISSALIYANWPEYHELTFLRRHLRAGEIVIDVGANVGHISLLLSDIVGPSGIFAFEPTPISFGRLRENWELNSWPIENVKHMAVGARSGTVFVPNVDRPLTTNTISNTSAKAASVEIPLVRLDDLRDLWHGQPIGLLKVDVEGYEQHVFRGARELLRIDRPRFVMFESLSAKIDPNVAALLADAEYAVFQLGPDGRPDFAGRSAQNLFAVPKEYRKQFDTDSAIQKVGISYAEISAQ